MLHITRTAAHNAAMLALAAGRADSYTLQQRRFRNPDRSFEQGWRAVLRFRGRVIGFA